jgi:hypothetical protein
VDRKLDHYYREVVKSSGSAARKSSERFGSGDFRADDTLAEAGRLAASCQKIAGSAGSGAPDQKKPQATAISLSGIA